MEARKQTGRKQSGSTLAGDAYRLIREGIRNGRFAPGERLRFADLQAFCGTSVSPLREALTRLTAEGFAVLDDHRGYSVAPLSLAELRDITANRRLLEGEALRLSIRHGEAEWEARLIAAHHLMTRVPQGRDDLPSAISEDWEARHAVFHATLIEACGSPILIEMCSKLFSRADRYRRMSVSLSGPTRDVEGEHRAILEKTLARDASGAADALGDHYQRTADALERFFDEKKD